MSVAELLTDLAQCGIRLEAHGDRLRYKPRSAVTLDLAKRMNTYKDELLSLLRPDVFAKGGSTDTVVERKVAESCGARVVTLDLIDGLSTTEIINRVLTNRDKP